jgi:aminomethyltransferase
LGKPIAVGYVDALFATPGSSIVAEVRGNRLPVTVSDIPFVTHAYKR